MAGSGRLERQGIERCLDNHPAEAIALLERALERDPSSTRIRGNLAVACALAGKWAAAEEHFRLVLEVTPEDSDAVAGRAWCLHELRRFEEALEAHRRAIALDGRSASVHRNLGRTLAALGRYPQAERVLEECLRLDPCDPRGWAELARVHHRMRRNHQALACRERIAELLPGDPMALAGLAGARFNTGQIEAAVDGFGEAVALGAGPMVRSEYLFALLHDPRATAQFLATEHARLWPGGEPVPAPSSGDAEKRLRIGYLSGEFCRCPGYHFLFPLLSGHNRRKFDIYCYYSGRIQDKGTGDFRRTASCWRDVAAWSTEGIASQIREDRIDILVDLSGHFTSGRFEVFPLRPAPVQVNYPNYPSTVGIREVDYLISDRWTALIETCSEEIVRLPSGFLVWRPPASPRIPPLPAQQNGFVTFGLFQRPPKMNGAVWDAVAEVLRATPGSQLLLHHATRDYSDPGLAARKHAVEALTRRGVSEARLEFVPGCPMEAHLAVLARADIALDTFPYNGQTTTCECLWMGVPVVTLAGDRLASRIGGGILSRLAMEEWVAREAREYVAIAVRRAADWAALGQTRRALRAKLRTSTLIDGRRVAGELEAAYRGMWRRHCGVRP